MAGISHQQIDDVKDAIDVAALIESAVVIYPSVSEQAGVSACAHDVIVDIACNRHPKESVAEFRENPAAFLRSGKGTGRMSPLGPPRPAQRPRYGTRSPCRSPAASRSPLGRRPPP